MAKLTVNALAEQMAASNAQIMQMMGQFTQAISALADKEGTAETIIENPATEQAIADRHKSIVEDAQPIVEQFKLLFQDVDPYVRAQMVSGLAYTARNQHFRSRRFAEWAAAKLLDMQEQGARSGNTAGNEIDDYGDAESRYRLQAQAMEQYEVFVVALEILWEKEVEPRAAEEGVELSFVPSFDIGERAFTEYSKKEADNFRKRQTQANSAQRVATSTLLRTERHLTKAE